MEKYEVIIIGAGQAGLAMGYFMQQTNVPFVLLDAHQRIGDSWRNRYDSLVLFTPKRYSGLPGFSFPGDPNSFPTKDETADYLERYANHFSLPVHLNTRVISLTKQDSHFLIATNRSIYQAKKVVVATGPFQQPFIPTMASELAEGIMHLHSSHYRNPAQLIPGNVLVIGGGNSGAQIASELAHYKQTYLSVGHPITCMPLQFLGKSIFWYLERFGLIQADLTTKKGKWVQQQREKVYGFELKKLLKKGKVVMKPRSTAIKDSTVKFADGTSLNVQNIIWATGFKMDFSWIHIEGFADKQNKPLHQKGVSVIKNLFFLGLPWLSCRGSALLGWVGQDAKRLIPYLVTP